jgi:hypothetical protein
MFKQKSFFVVLIFTLFFCLALASCGGGGGGTSVLLSENFSSFTEGSAFTSSSWTAIDGGTIPPPDWNIQEAVKALDVDSYGFIVYTGTGSPSWTNYTYTFNFKVTNTSVIATAFFRFIGGAEPGLSYYFINIEGGNTLSLGKAPSNNASSYGITSTTISYLADTYYPVKIEVNGNNIKIYFNGATTPDINYTDDGSTYGDLQPAGSVGIGSPNAPDVYFDDLVVTSM